MSNLMENDVYNAAVNGDVTIFSNKNHEHLLKKTYQNDNIIHIAAQHKQLDFIKRALNSFPSTPTCESLICDQNLQGNTPLHLAADAGDEAIIDQLYQFFSTQCGSYRVFPWRVVNGEGNTSAHVALLRSKISVAMYLVEKDDYVARVTNDSKETLLHLAIQYHISGGNLENDDSQIPETQATSSSKKVYQPIKDLLPIVELLLKIDSSVTCWADTDGLTPLHRAASLEPAYKHRVIKAILASCSEAAKIHVEGSGNTILHLLTNRQVASYEEGQELMSIPQVYALKNSTNHQRDTPLHLAARNRDTIMVRVLKGSSPDLGLKNKSGVSADSLVREFEHQMRTTDRPVEYRRKLTEEECEAARKGNVAFLNERLESLGMDFLVSQTPAEGNILHALMKCEFDRDSAHKAIEFTKQAVQILPSIIRQQDRDGNTFLHLILERTYISYFNNIFLIVEREASDQAKVEPHSSLYRLKNVQGDTPLHLAIRVKNYDFAIEILKVDSEVAGYVNNRKQTPLHLLSHIGRYTDSKTVDQLINGMINGNGDVPYMQDEDGLTPFLVAVRERNLDVIKTLNEQFPASARIADFKGRTLWHWFGYRHLEQSSSFGAEYSESLLSETWNFLIFSEGNSYLMSLMKSQDNDGNTPLHIAIANKQFSLAQFFITYRRMGAEELLGIENKEGVSSFDLIGSAEHLPREFAKFLLEAGNLLSGHRSLYSIPTTKIEAYTNTIGVIAALLATITFTAAFTVPSGLDSSNGAPLLLGKAMFQVFMVADVLAMSSSVTALFCLLWIMTTGNKRESILLLDVSVFLVQTSFYATLATFMTGLYVTTITIVPAIAISTCVICTLLIILLNKRLVMWTIVPFFGALITYVPIIIGHPREALSALWYRIRQLKYLCFSKNTKSRCNVLHHK